MTLIRIIQSLLVEVQRVDSGQSPSDSPPTLKLDCFVLTMRCKKLVISPVFLEIIVDIIAYSKQVGYSGTSMFKDVNNTIKAKLIQLERRGTVRRRLSRINSDGQ